ncbi:arginine-tRNA--protein transferase 1 [Gigaspora margarita]|uniref:Arginyl-tRNA--protein transferase 1 n=1 Tax=Gigaspora margarita TaxID=4874 RepID=A0A8H4AIN0_GIGMA|nr:arginine-tRNA--protein transferase 1 [Gigaspora margarita]
MSTSLGYSFVQSHGSYASECGYCNSGEDTSHKFGLSAIRLTCQDYQDLIDRGWRRSGTFIYKPNLRDSCCPQYTIRLDATKFHASKSQRQLINRFNRFLEGTYVPSDANDTDSNKDKSKSRKRTENTFDLIEAIHEAEGRIDLKHKFKITIELSSFTQEKYQLYCKYQTIIHNDTELSEESFRRFLVNSPLKHEPQVTPNTPGYGSFHQCYYLDDKLIAVAVLDILPKCASSVYFFYDPDFSYLQLGKYSALREISMTLDLHIAGLKDLHWYYMGYYIHNCQKMSYKGQYKPSDLLDPETYEWHPFENCTRLLNQYKYVSFANPPSDVQSANHETSGQCAENIDLSSPGMLDPNKVTDDAIKDMLVYIGGAVKRFNSVPYLNQFGEKSLLKEYYAAVGPELAKKMVLIMY